MQTSLPKNVFKKNVLGGFPGCALLMFSLLSLAVRGNEELLPLITVADRHFSKGEYAEARAKYYEAVEKTDNLHARNQLGKIYFSGLGVKRDLHKAFVHFKYAAERGAPAAQAMVGIMSLEGLGTLKDPAAAVQWYTEAIKGKNDIAAFNLAMLYYEGTGVEKDTIKYLEYLRLAASLGNARALFELGNEYRDGRFLLRNLEQAAACYAKAASMGNLFAQFSLGLAYANGEGVNQDLAKAKLCIKMVYDAAETDENLRERCNQVWQKYKLYNY